jgi:ethanolamine utilization protein EutL
MLHDRLYANVLAVRIVPNVSNDLADVLNLPPDRRSIGILTADIDDATYVGLDAATKAADVIVAYAHSMYAGSAAASTRLAGEVVGILAGPNPAQVQSGLDACIRCMQKEAYFISADETDSIVYFAHTVSRTGSYLSAQAHIPEGEPLAYLIAPPLEAVYALDAALKAADVRLCEYYAPPSETNFAGGLLTGTQSACEAAAAAFAQAVEEVAKQPERRII